MQYLFAFAFMAAFAVGTGAIADRKGRNVIGWSMVGLFLGVLGLLIAAVMPSKKPAFE
jgi:MFS family permease